MQKFLRQLTLLSVLMLIGSALLGQTKLSVRINNASDDLEEYIPGAGQTKEVGTLDVGSSDLELGSESRNNVDPQLVGLRFAGLAIPKGAFILRASIRFTIDANSKNTDPSRLVVLAQAADNPATFGTEKFAISARPRLQDSVVWNVRAGSGATVGESGVDQTTPDLTSLVQALVNRSGWASGNAMVFMIYGTGLREVESFDGSAEQAPILEIEYFVPAVVNARVASPEDDLEEYIAGPGQTKTLGTMDAGSSDLELGSEARNNVDPQLVGIRFANLNIPKGARILNAYIQFWVDATNKNTDPSNLIVRAQAADNPATFDPAIPFNISSRPRTADSVVWNIPNGSWATVGLNGADQRTPNLAALVQQLVNRNGWAPGNAMAFMISGTGTREAEAADSGPDTAPLLVVEYLEVKEVVYKPLDPDDDMEEYIAGAGQTKTLGSMDAGSSDLELGSEARNNVDPQLVGVRFRNIDLPKGAVIQEAYIQFTNDATSKNTDPSNLVVKVQDADNPGIFVPTIPFNISSRPVRSDSVNWNIAPGSWNAVGQAGPDQRTPNLANLVQATVNRSGWASGNAMAFMIKGTGTREAEAVDSGPDTAPRLVVRYLSSGVKTGLAATEYPVNEKEKWAFSDKTTAPANDWTTLAFNDTEWGTGNGPLGYNEPGLGTEVAKVNTVYFRKKVNVADFSKVADNLELNLRVDDGAIVYINNVEVARTNMPAGAATFATAANKNVENDAELAYFLFDLPKSVLKQGENIIAVEVHQFAASTDMVFDLSLRNRLQAPENPALGCNGPNDLHISCFNSLIPRAKADTLQLPSTHAFQYLLTEGTPYTVGGGNVPGVFDFTGFVPINGSSRNGYVSINHEIDPIGGVSMTDVSFNTVTGLWAVTRSQAVDFGGELVRTVRNCSGEVTPWNTVITCEEEYSSADTDTNNDGYIDIGWCTEIDPATRQVRDYGTGTRQKLWALGRMSHENVKVASDRKTVYFGEDDSNGAVYKFIADQADNLTAGQLFALKLNQAVVNGEPTGTTGTWVRVPNTTKAERNRTHDLAIELMASLFAGVEDVDISPTDGKIYFAVKGVGRVYRFKDDGTTVSQFETFVGGRSYRINTGNGVVSEDWAGGNDNLTFDNRGNLYVLQDGGRDHVWLVRNDHTQASPKVELFLQTPSGSEPTGMTFTPDFRYMFLSIQGPSGRIPQKDVAGRSEIFNKSIALVIARKPYLGVNQITSVNEVDPASAKMLVYPNPTANEFNLEVTLARSEAVKLALYDLAGRQVAQLATGVLPAGTNRFNFSAPELGLSTGMYFLRLETGGKVSTTKLMIQE